MTIGGAVEKAVAGRWIAGESIADAAKAAVAMNANGATAMVNYLGEDFNKEGDVSETVRTYRSLISETVSSKLRISIAIKPTQIGLLIGRKELAKNYSEIVSLARKHKTFVWLDMEQHQHVDDTINLYLKEVKKGGTGICIQSYLKRSDGDVRALVKKGGTIRLVKGAYRESADIAYPSRTETTKNYVLLMRYLFKNSESFMAATHDKKIITEALGLKKRSRAKVSFGMLNGIMNDYAYRLAKSNNVSIYLPFGGRWVSYSYRRLKELENSKLILRSLLKSQY